MSDAQIKKFLRQVHPNLSVEDSFLLSHFRFVWLGADEQIELDLADAIASA